MNYEPKLTKIELITEIGEFIFQNHHNHNINFYNSMTLFEANNWATLGETHYRAFLEYSDGNTGQEVFRGINASAYLAAFIDNCDIPK